jgi:hypothetical protein
LSDHSYSFLERVLHHLALGFPLVAEASFDFEQAMLKSRLAAVTDRPHVFVAGLARSGTTALMQAIHATGRFRSLTYRDMPFVLMPNSWKRLSAGFRKRAPERERWHRDGIKISFDSPEALEEVFWRVFAGHDFLRRDSLRPHEPDQELVERFRGYVAAILHAERSRDAELYLSKNNNNILRLSTIRKAFPAAVILIPFRHPARQARSLAAQHEHFTAVQAKDRFARHYMTWLAHHEFGLTHRPFIFEQSEMEALSRHTQSDLGYWLTLWHCAYRYLLSQAPDGAVFIDYEALCAQPSVVLARALAATGLDLDFRSAGLAVSARSESHLTDGPQMAEALAIYARLLSRAQHVSDRPGQQAGAQPAVRQPG